MIQRIFRAKKYINSANISYGDTYDAVYQTQESLGKDSIFKGIVECQL